MFDPIKKMYGAQTAIIDGQAPTADVSLVAAVAGRRCVVDSLTLTWDPHAATAFFEKGTTTKITPTFQLQAAGGTFTVYDPGISTDVNQALTFTSVGASSVVGVLVRFHMEGPGT